jgi:hypothetical protein
MRRKVKLAAVLMALAAWCGCAALSRGQSAATAAATTSASSGHAISGTLVNAKSGLPIADADVYLSDTRENKRAAETKTDSEGRFSFSDLRDGKYGLRASHRGFVAAYFQEHQGFWTGIVTGDGLETTGLKMTLDPQGILYGTVTDESGDPVPQARISLYRPDPNSGTGKMQRAGSASSDGLGNFEFPRLSPGSYYLSVVGKPWYSTHPQPRLDADGSLIDDAHHYPLDVAYPTTYYPDVTEAGSAATIPVTAGDRIPVNLVLHPVPAVHVSMKVPNPGLNQPMATPQFREDVFGFSEVAQGNVRYYQSHLDQQGGTTTVQIDGLAPGTYDLELRTFSGSNDAGSRMTTVDATTDRISVDVSSAQPMADVSGKLAMAGSAALPSGLSAMLSSQKGEERMGQPVGADGTFHFQSMRPGTYELTVRASGKSLAVTQLTASGATVTGHLVKIGSESVELNAVLAEVSGSVSGFATLDGKPAPGVFVLLVPADPNAGTEAYRPDQSDSDGSFEYKRVIAGQYTVVAIEDGWTLEWARPEVMAKYLAKGVKVTVPRRSADIALKDAVEMQAK